MKIQVNWKATIALTLILLALSTGVNLALLALSSPAVLVPLLLLVGLFLVSVGKEGSDREKIRGLLKQQKEIVKSLVGCFFGKEERSRDSRNSSRNRP